MDVLIAWVFGLGLIFILISLLYSNGKNLLQKVKARSSRKFDKEYFKNNINIFSQYWGSVLEGIQPLENGKTFSSENFYNPIHLKYDLRYIESSLLFMAKVFKDKNEIDKFNLARNSHALLGNFVQGLNTDFKAESERMMEIINDYTNHKDTKNIDFAEMTKKITKIDSNAMSESHNLLIEVIVKQNKKFDDFFKDK